MKIVTALCALLLLALCCVSAASAGGMVKFHIPAVENAKVGDTVTVTLYNDNNLNPPTGDLSIYLDWNMEVLKYESSTFKQGRTTAADLVGLHNLNIMAADTTNGFPQGDNPLIVMKFKVIGPGFTPIVMKVASITDITGADISSKAVVSNGAVTATGTAAKTTTGTTVPTTVPTTTTPASGTTLSPAGNPVSAVPVVTGPATVPFNTGVFSITSVGNVPVGAMGTVQVVVDNAWEPLFSDTYIDIKFDPSMVRYSTSSIHVANTTAAATSDGMVRIMLGDFRHGYPSGRYAIADVTFTALREGTTPLTVSVDHVRYWNSDFTRFTDISSSASTQSGTFSTGPVSGTPAPGVPAGTTYADARASYVSGSTAWSNAWGASDFGLIRQYLTQSKTEFTGALTTANAINDPANTANLALVRSVATAYIALADAALAMYDGTDAYSAGQTQMGAANYAAAATSFQTAADRSDASKTLFGQATVTLQSVSYVGTEYGDGTAYTAVIVPILNGKAQYVGDYATYARAWQHTALAFQARTAGDQATFRSEGTQAMNLFAGLRANPIFSADATTNYNILVGMLA